MPGQWPPSAKAFYFCANLEKQHTRHNYSSIKFLASLQYRLYWKQIKTIVPEVNNTNSQRCTFTSCGKSLLPSQRPPQAPAALPYMKEAKGKQQTDSRMFKHYSSRQICAVYNPTKDSWCKYAWHICHNLVIYKVSFTVFFSPMRFNLHVEINAIKQALPVTWLPKLEWKTKSVWPNPATACSPCSDHRDPVFFSPPQGFLNWTLEVPKILLTDPRSPASLLSLPAISNRRQMHVSQNKHDSTL